MNEQLRNNLFVPYTYDYTYVPESWSASISEAVNDSRYTFDLKIYIDNRINELKEKIYDILKDMGKIEATKEEWMALLEDC